MPRVKMKRLDYMMDDYIKWIKVQMVVHDMKYQDMGDLLGISAPGFCYKMKNKTFSLEDILKINSVFKPKGEELEKLLV